MWVINTTRQKMVVLHTIIRFFSIAGCFQIGLYEGMICIFGLPSALGPLTNLKQNRLSVSAPEYMSIKYRLRLKNSEWDPKQGQCHSLYALLLYAFNSWANTVNSIFYELSCPDIWASKCSSMFFYINLSSCGPPAAQKCFRKMLKAEISGVVT